MPETIGERLKRAREERYISIEKAEAATRIRSNFLRALEANDYSVMPSAAQARGFLRNYAEYLELDLDAIMDEIQRAQSAQPEDVSGPLPNVIKDALPPAPDIIENDSQTSTGERRTFRSILTSRRARRQQPESTPEPESATPAPTMEQPPVETPPIVEAENVEPEKPKRKRKKIVFEEIENPPPAPVAVEIESPAPVVELSQPTDENQTTREILPEETAQVEAGEEAKTGLFARLKSMLRLSVHSSPEDEVAEESPQADQPVIESESVVTNQTAEEILSDIGKQLRAQREMLSLTLDEVERHTRVRAVFLKALEEGALDQLPSSAQMRGMLANYAAFLNMDTDAVMLRFADAIQARHRAKYPDKPAGYKPPMEVAKSLPWFRGFIAGDLLFGFTIVALLFGLAIWGIRRVIAIQSEQVAKPTAPSIPDVLSSTERPTPIAQNTLAVAAATPTINATEATVEIPSQIANVQIIVVAVESAFLRVAVDGKDEFNGRVMGSETLTFEAQDQIVVLTGNGAALRVTFNGRDLGFMGSVGEVINRVYTPFGITTPTPTLPPTPTNTPLESPTPTVTETPPPTPTLATPIQP